MSPAETSDTTEIRQAPDELANRKIAAVTVASLVIMGIALAVAWILLGRWGHVPPRAAPPSAPQTIGILEQSLVLHTERGVELRKQQQTSLDRWGWSDRDAGIARIPIETAIDVLAASPLPIDRPLSDFSGSSTREEGAP